VASGTCLLWLTRSKVYLLLLLYFKVIGGYKPLSITRFSRPKMGRYSWYRIKLAQSLIPRRGVTTNTGERVFASKKTPYVSRNRGRLRLRADLFRLDQAIVHSNSFCHASQLDSVLLPVLPSPRKILLELCTLPGCARAAGPCALTHGKCAMEMSRFWAVSPT
jgi:hypothetical protein